MRRLALALLAALALAACGQDERPPAPPGSAANPLRAVTDPAADPDAGAAQPGYEELVAQQDAAPRSRFTPCNLVTERQAAEILGGPVQAPFEAPQGPTCIYRSERGSAFVTLAVEARGVDELRARLQQPRRVSLGGRTGYCGQDGRPVLYVALRDDAALSVSGACDVAAAFAARAVREF